ncbi:MAG: hypothetical protein HYU80_03120 [Candidatus Blackburnbacteria bacterium]|nr:hypothetical protein [Candidatus Blackburnbacteria bacterium]
MNSMVDIVSSVNWKPFVLGFLAFYWAIMMQTFGVEFPYAQTVQQALSQWLSTHPCWLSVVVQTFFDSFHSTSGVE